LGLFWALDLVRNRESKQPFNSMKEKVSGQPLMVDRITAGLMARGVAMQGWISHLVLAPPLIVEESDMDLAVAALDETLSIADAAMTSYES
jgi:taurine--2-oxoglutarate transaminase